MNPLEEKLRTAIIETGAEVPPDHHSPPLRLPRQARRSPGMLRRGGPRHWPAWLAPLVTAIAVTAVIAGTLVVSHLVFGVTRHPAAVPPPSYERLPPYYAGFTPDGGFGIRETATGRLLRAIRSYVVATATPDGRTFVVGSLPPPRPPGSGAAGAGLRTPAEPLRFEVVHVTPGGTTHASHLSLPIAVTQDPLPSIALSPDGRRLAVAYAPHRAHGAAVVQVIALGTGTVRQWVWPNVKWAPFVSGTGAWSADGRTLAVQQHVWSLRLLSAPREFLLDTASGGRLTKQVVLHVPAGYRMDTLPMLTPNGAELIAPIETGKLPNPWHGGIASFSARTGALLDVRGHWETSAHQVRAWDTLQILAWTNWSGSKLIEVQPGGSAQVLGELSGGAFSRTGALLPRQASGYRDLRGALIANSGVIG
jgi:hypothetical protein